ncbi:MAG TPA: hypothetical protein DEF88_12350 [Porphyromonadaceae bacterium]|jgi:predicted small secreted protein|nr:hypothetical protein [Porphyromonadaceae bacterium]HBX21228.1 hypothetical protein [Porphyromonadaceae bacterium]HCM20606.1 hypothetical protein [Porphyromonadaceae bacterium]
MKYTYYIYAVALAFALSVAGCNKTDDTGIGDDMQVIDGIELGLGAVETSSEATTRATVNNVVYAVNTTEDPTRTKNAQNFITDRNEWKLDFHLFNGNVEDKYTPGSFIGQTDSDNDGNWKPSGDFFFPNYFKPWAALWLYYDTKDKEVAKIQSDKTVFLQQDQLYRPKSQLGSIAKKISVELQHQRAMINFKFEGIQRSDIVESSVKVVVNGEIYTPYNVRTDGTLEYLLILPESIKTSDGTGMKVTYSTVNFPSGASIHQSIDYELPVTLNSGNELGSNNCYCFTLSGKELSISPVTIVNWTTGEPVSGEYVAVTAYPTFKGPANKTYYFYYDNKLVDAQGKAILQAINFNKDGECTIKPDGRIITHILTNAADIPTDQNKLVPPIILGNTEKMYIAI